MSKLVATETCEIKHGRFRAVVTKEYYDGPEERKAQVEALKIVKSLGGVKADSKV